MLAALLLALLTAGIDGQARPATIRLGVDERAALHFKGPPGELSLTTSVGEIVELRQVSPGEWTAAWIPPTSSIPGVAVIVARSGAAAGLVSLPMWGQGEAEVRTRPGAVVDVRIGEETFGPARADGEGIAWVPVVVAPGVDFGSQGSRKIDLHVPRARTVQIGPLAPIEGSDRDQELEVVVAAVERGGAPLAAAPIELSVTRGAISRLESIGNGLYGAVWTLPAGKPGTATLRATRPGDPEPSTVTIRMLAGLAARIELTPAAATVHAGGEPAVFTVRAFDGLGNPSGEPLRFSSGQGTLLARAVAHGVWQVEVQPPTVLEDSRAMRLIVQPQSRPAPSAESLVTLQPGQPVRIDVSTDAPFVVADGKSTVRVRLTARDRFGNDSGVVPRVSASAGTLIEPGDGGAKEARFVAPLSNDPGDAVLEATAGQASGRTRLVLLPRIHPVAISLRAGGLTDLHGLNASVLGLESSYRRGRFALTAGAAWAATAGSNSVPASPGAPVLHSREDFLLLSLGGAVRFPFSERMLFWAHAGGLVAAAAARVRVESAGAPPSQSTSRGAVPGFELGAGIERRMWGGAPFVELRFIATQPFSLPNLEGTLTGASLCAGYRLELL